MLVMPPQSPFAPNTTRPQGYWVGESKAIGATVFGLQRVRPIQGKVGALLIVPSEMREDTSLQNQIRMREFIVEGVTQAMDQAFVDPSNAGTSTKPASVFHGCPTFASGGDVTNDVTDMIDNFSGTLSRAAWIGHPRLAVQIAMRIGNAAAAELGALGGRLVGLPFITSESCEFTSDGATLGLVDCGAIGASDLGLQIEASSDATIEMNDAPAGASDTPTAAASHFVSMFITHSTALKISRRVSWRLLSEVAAVTCTGCAYTS
jgi:hypothetical protein